MKRRLSLIITLAALLFFCGNHAAAKDTWTRVQTKNFILVGNASESDIRKIAIKLETFRETLSLLFPKARITTAVPTTVVIFKSNDAFRPFKPRYQGKIRDNVGGYFLSRSHMNYIALSADKEFIDPYEVIFHEYEHFVLRNNLDNIPLWLNEGLAEYYSSFETADNDQRVKLGMPLEKHIGYLRNNPLLPLKTLLEVDHKSPHYNESSKTGAFYAESWALVHYLMNGNKQKRQPQLLKFIELVSSGVSSEASFKEAFGADFKTVEDELRTYLNKFLFPMMIGTFRTQLNFDKEMTSATLSQAQVQYYEGDLLLNLGQLPEAKVLLEKSVALDGRYAPSLVSLGTLRLTERRPDEAMKLFQSAIESDPGNYLGHYYYAGALSREQRHEEAIKSYRQAIALKPDHSILFSGLGFSYLAAGNETEAVKTFEEGLRVNKHHSDFYRILGYIHLGRRDGDAASRDAYEYLKRRGWRDENSHYLALVWYFGLRQAKHDEFATKTMQDALVKLDRAEWPYPVVQFINQKLTLAEMLTQANDNDKLTEAHAYAGLVLSLNGESAAALEHLRWVKDNGNKDFSEYKLAMLEIARLENSAAASP